MKKENFILKIYSITLTLILGFIFLTSFKSINSNQKFDEITVERINIIEPDGKLKMVISNQVRQHPGMHNGETLDPRERPPGIIFFNEEQDEIGGLAFYGNKESGGNNLFLSVDQYKNDQVMQLKQSSNNNGDNQYGLQLWERDKKLTPDVLQKTLDSLDKVGYRYQQKMDYLREMNDGNPINEPRLFIGKKYNRETGLFIQDKSGIDRLRLYIDSNDSPKIEVLDEKGNIINNILEK
ncbi:hypothetical protein [Urechidicola vernalis]|uniref:Uncharacterized protein n=1 Tax=Urechidicola vernalis TaxID=3075600 RepID=A0ABU2Y8F7_9FLAO|nr:hypothetical protein [Urechidicola sp. P050]MDT0554126.1 hypothetical protein [Urechidicola sp. P050]